MFVLGLETSCDDTAAAVLQDGKKLLSNIINDQTRVHSKFGGIVPELAGRTHVDQLQKVIRHSLKSAEIELNQIEGICDPVHLSEVITKSGTKKNKSKYFEKEFISIIESKECNFSLSEKSDLLDKISLVASADSELHEKEREVLYKVAKLLDMPKTYVDAIIKKMSS